jgi:uncharacterized membrane-anchored protein YjiN (DUF445 family)
MEDAQALPATLADTDNSAAKILRLARSKRIALTFLLVPCALFIALTAVDPQHHSIGLGLFAAMAEAAMVGGLADWFAVTALFRHPMGQAWIPHTAIIPKSKDQIGKSLADFICDHFLDSKLVLGKIIDFNPASRLAKSLAEPASAAKLADFVVKHAPRLVEMLDSNELQEFVSTATKEKLRGLDLSSLLANLLDTLTKDGRHNEMVDSLLDDIAALASDPETRSMLAEKIAPELWAAARWTNLDRPIADNIAEKVVAGFQNMVREIAIDKHHKLRVSFDEKIPLFMSRLKTDADLRGKIESFRDTILDNRELSDYIQEMWSSAISWLRNDLSSPVSSIRENVVRASQSLGSRLDSDPELKAWFNNWVLDTVEPLVEEYREKIRGFIVDRVEAWSSAELTMQLELSMGSDLQSIRISGTVVGAIIGGLLFGLMHLVGFIAS